MNKREIILICIILCFICSCQAVMAADISSNSTNTNVTSASTIEVVDSSNDLLSYSPSQNNETLGVGGGSFTELNNLIAGSTDSVITLGKNYTFVSGTDDAYATGILINRNVEIIGNGYTIDASNQARAFRIAQANTVTLTGITFINGYSQAANGIPGQGGAVLGSGVVHIDNCKFIDNTAYYANGGAVCLVGSGSTITNSYFEGNKAIKNPNNEQSGGAGAVFINANNSAISHSTFIKNEAGLNGGAIGSSANYLEYITITNCTISNNTAGGSAGGIGMQSKNFHITDSTFKYNEAKGQFTTYPGNGGAMVMRGWDSYAYNCTFIGNIAKQHGGAVFSTNTSYNSLNNNTGFELCTFIDNIAGYNGGAVGWAAGANYGYIINSTFDNNTAKCSGGAVHWSGYYGTVSNSTFINNKATGDVISEIGGVTGGGDGGAIIWSGALGTVEMSNFVNNSAAKRGGAIFLQGSETEPCENTSFTDSYFAHNVAGTNGGAIDWFEGAHNGFVANVTFINNTAKRSGGAIFWHGDNGTVKNSKFYNNRATGTAWEYIWAITKDDIILYDETHEDFLKTTPTADNLNKLYVINETLSDNRDYFVSYVAVKNATGDGYHWEKLDETYISLSDSIISPVDWATDQYFGGDGGTILWSGDIGLIENCTFIDSNSARRGGGAYMTGSDYVTFDDCYFENCTSGTNGGGVDWLAGANYGKIHNTIFNNTRAARSAGAIYYDGDYGEMINITIINATSNGGSLKVSKDGLVNYAGWDSSHWDTNTTGGDAGAIMFTGDHEYIYNATFINCTSVGRGGAVFLQDNSNITFDLCVFENNTALGIANNTWKNYTEERNDADNDTKVDYRLTGHGGAIAFDVGAHAGVIKNSKFINNYARRDGGAINFATGAYNGTLENTIFTNNSCGDDGGAINWEGDSGTIKNITCYNNTGKSFNDDVTGASTSNGGTICLTGSNVTISDSSFKLSTVLLGASTDKVPYGGAIFLTGDNTNITNTTFDTCYCPDDAGAIYVIGNYTFIDNCTFENCHSNENGGVMYIVGDYCKLYNSTITNNYAGNDGGAISWQGDHGIVYNITCTNNRAVSMSTHFSNGGTMAIEGDNITISKSKFSKTSALIAGGAIYVTGNFINITDSEFEYCNVSLTENPKEGKKYSTGGGAIYVLGNETNIENCNFTRNNAKHGGILYIQGNNVNVTNITSDFTYSSLEGGSIYVEGANATISDSSFTRTNSTGSKAGSIYVSGDNAIINNTEFRMNNAPDDGGAIYIAGQNTIVSGTNLTMCSSGSRGGSIYVEGYNATIEKADISMSNATLDGGAIYIKGNNATIMDSTIKQAHARNGGAIYVVGMPAVINGSSISMSSSDVSGGAIYVEGNNATIEKSVFDKNNATKDGGAIYVHGDNSHIIDSNFTIDIALTGNGGAIYVGGVNTVISGATSSITRSVQGQGGSIYVNGADTVIKDSSFNMSNSAMEGGSIYINGARSKVIDTNISMTTSATEGGAVYILAENALISGSHFDKNNATKNGGAIYIKGQYANITNSTFNQGNSFLIPPTNSNLAGGGAIFCEGSYANIYYSNFTNCYAVTNGGAIYFYAGTGSLNNCTVVGSKFINNRADSKASAKTKGGGAIYWSEGGYYNSIKDSEFINNSAVGTTEVEGGAVLWDYSYYTVIDNCTFDGNYLNSTAKWVQGGAIYARAQDLNNAVNNFNITNNLFKNCWSKEAGAMYIATQTKQFYVLICNNTFINNTATGYLDNPTDDNYGGGAILFKEIKDGWLINNTFINNTANQGGAVSCYKFRSNSNYFINCTFDGNYAIIKGGAIFSPNDGNAVLNLDNITFVNNIAGTNGGAVYTYYMNPNKLTFINNTAENGGALYWDRSGVSITDMVFINNTAANRGGAIYAVQQNIKILKNNFTNNSANEGGAIYVNQGGITVSENNFTNNNATSGGALYIDIYSNANNVVTSLNNFTGNVAQEGGAIYVPVALRGVSILSSNFTKNHAFNGGAIYTGSKGFSSNNRYIMDCIFTENVADINGGAIYLTGVDQVISNCVFDGNNASGDGGSIFVADSATATVQDSTFRNSHAANGGAIYNSGSTGAQFIIRNDTFIKNTAIYNGGAVLYYANNGVLAYRDYLNFTIDGITSVGVVNPNTGRTDVSTPSNVQFIYNSLFEDNEDYVLRITTVSDMVLPSITVYLSNPRDVNRRTINFVVNLSDSTGLVKQVNVTNDNFASHYNSELNLVYVTFDELRINGTYNISVGYSDLYYMYKENSTSEQAHGTMIGEFQLLQYYIEGNITVGNYNISLGRSFRFTPFYFDQPLDDRCMNLTNIDKPLIINGHGWVLDARGFSRIFNITSSNITLINVVFANGNASGEYGDGSDIGGALFIAGQNVTLINCTFFENAAHIGGGIYYNTSASGAKIINNTFENNTAVTNGGAIDCNAPEMELINTTFDSNYANVGAALCREVNATGGHGSNNVFINNHAETAGAALAWINASSIHIDTYYFYNNTAGYSGGAIYVGEGSGNCEIVNCLFDNNYVVNENDGHGGAIEWYAKTGLVSNSNFTRNHAYDGGAIYVGSDSGNINITESTFSNNYAATVGGAISIEASAVTVNASNFYDNNATRGGALYVGGNGTTNYIYSSVFERNIAFGTGDIDGLGGAIDWVASSGHIIDTNFTGNCADYGGGVYFGGKSNESVITSCIFTDNHAKYNGGAIDCNASKMYLTHTLFDGNYAQFGAALCRETNAKSGSGENNTFINNHAYVSGAALGWMGSGIKITNYTFINNSADVSGGAIYVSPSSHNCSIIDSRFIDNYVTNQTIDWYDDQFSWTAWDNTTVTYRALSTWDPEMVNMTIMYEQETVLYYNMTQYPQDFGVGGAMNILASNATIINSEFTGNIARLGGGLYVGADSGNTVINQSTFKSNIAYERGGAVNLYASGVHIDDSEFWDNIAVNGSALYVGGIGTENKVHGSRFEGNNASGYGAGIYWIAQEGEIINSTFNMNSAVYGGGIYLNGRSANTNITNVTFTSNNATKNGGAIECNASNIGIYNLTFDSNYAGEYGAALCREIGATSGNGSHNLFKNNHAGIAGAALAWMGVDNIHIIDYTFIDNTAGDSGGAIYIAEGSDNDIIENCTFEGNHLTNMSDFHYGGAIDCRGENLTIDTVIFTNNGAFTGGAIYVGAFSKDVHIFDSNFTSNYAYGDGGAIGFKASSLSINNTIFKSNTAVRHGGALYAGGTGTNNTIYYSSFEYNTAGDHGGAIDWLASAGIFKYINFTGNQAKYGGALYLNGVSSNSSLESIYFKANRATMNGGAIDCNASMMGLNNVLFEENVAGEYGGALCREANATGGYGGNNTFIKNHADIGGAALAWLGVDGININKYRFINNTADLYGGAIYVRGDSPNCKVRNSYFDNNYIIDIRRGQGGAIYWLGENATVLNSTFLNSFATEGGTLYIGGDNANITKSNFSYSAAFVNGGAISGHNANNASITDCIFNKNVGSGYLDSSNRVYGSGGAIYWVNSNNLNFLNLKIIDTESHSNGALSLVNCNDSKIYNVTFKGAISIRDGSSISWVNSTNGIIDLCDFLATAATYNGGSIFLDNIDNFIVSNSNFSTTHALYGNGGGIFVNGNATFNNLSFEQYMAAEDYAGGIFVYAGNSTIANSKFNGPDVIWVNESAITYLINNYITGSNPNKDITYLEKPYDARYNKYDYAVWNDGDLYLYNNTFDYLIFNNGTIWTNTTTRILNNQTWNETWNETFTFFANITDDNNNTIISVHTLDTWNDVFPDDPHYPMSYNALVNTRMIYQGNFTIFGQDSGLKKNTVYYGHVNVKMPTELTVNYTKEHDEKIDFTVRISVPVQSNYTFDINKLVIKVNGQVIPNADIIFSGLGDKWSVVYANFTRTHMRVGTYTITAEYMGDTFHEASQNSTGLVLFSRSIWIKVHAENIFYGQTLIVNINSNATNTEYSKVIITIDGREVSIPLHLNSDGSLVYRLPNENYTSLIEPGNHIISVRFYNGTYYGEQSNYSFFNVFKLDTPLNVNYTNITYGENELINVTVNKTASGYIALRIGESVYVAIIKDGIARFNIQNLAAGTYNATITFPGDNHFNANVTNITFNVGPTSNYIFNVTVDDIVYGQNATVRVLLNTSATGTVTIYINGTSYGPVQLVNGEAILRDISGLEGGKYVVNVTYSGDITFTPGYKNNTNFTVSAKKWDPSITQVDYRPYGEYTTINVTNIPKDLKGNTIVIQIDGINYTCIIYNGKATLRLNNLSAGDHSGLVLYLGDVNYEPLHKIFHPNIPKATPTIKLTQDSRNVIATVSGNATGTVTFYIGDNAYLVDLDGRNATLVGKLDYGTNVVSATYNGDQNYTTADARATFEVPRLPSLVNVTVIDTVYGNHVEITVQVGKGQTGSVKIEVNGNTYMSDLENEQAKFYITGLNVNEYTVTVHYDGDHVYLPNDNSTKFNVTKADLSVDVSALNITVEDNITFIIHVLNSDFAGNVNITVIDGINYDDVVKTLIVMGKLPVAGKYTADVTFYGDNNYKNKTLKVEFTISRVTPSIDVVIDNVIYPNKAIALINIGNKANGTVNVTVDGETFEGIVTDGTARVELSGDHAGPKEATVKFFATDSYNNNVTAIGRFTIDKASSAIEIIVKEIYKVGQDIVIGLKPVNSTGDITVTINGESKPVVNNKVTIAGGLAEGTYTIVANLADDDSYASVTNSTTFRVVKNTIKLDLNVGGDAHVGDDKTITVTLNVTDATGNILISVNDANYIVPIDNGVASLTLKDLENITYTIKASYIGDDKYLGNESDVDSFNVSKNPVSIIVNVNSPITLGETATVTININPLVNETVTLTVGNKTYNKIYNVVVINGVGTYDLFGFENEGTYDVNVSFAGDKKYLASKNSTQLVVNKVSNYDLDVYVSDINYGDVETILIVLPIDANVTKLVVKVNEYTYYPDTMINGFVTLNIPDLDDGRYEVNVTYLGDDKYGRKENNSNFFNVNPAAGYDIVITVDNHTYGEYTTINVTLPNDIDINNNVTIVVDGVSYSRKANVQDDYAIATLSLNNLTGGLHLITATYPGGGSYVYNSNSTVFSVDRKESTIDVEFITPASAGEGVLFNVSMGQKINGSAILTVGDHIYNVVLINGNGSYTVYGLMNGNYNVKVEFAGNENYTNSSSSVKTLVVNKATTTVSLIDVTIEEGKVATIIITVTEGATGVVNVTVNGITQSIGLIDSKATVYVPNLRNGSYPITVKYGGDDKHLPSENITQYIYVNKVSDYDFTVIASDTVVGGNSTVTVYMPRDANGNITIGSKTTKVAGGKAVIVLDKETISGEKSVTVTYGDDSKYADKTFVDVAKYNVDKAPSSVKIDVDSLYVIGDTVEINLTTVNGTATVNINGKNYVVTNNKVTFKANVTGPYLVVATIEGNVSYDKSSDFKVFNIVKASSAIEIIVKEINKVGETIVITLNPTNSTGDISVTINGVTQTVTTDKKVYVSGLTEGTYTIVANLASDDKYESSTAFKVFNVVKNNLTVTLSDVSTIKVGTPVTFTATLNESAKGDVIFNINGVNYTVSINGLTTTYTYTPVNNDTLNVVATFMGSDEFNANSSALKSYPVLKFASSVSLSDVIIKVGETAKIVISVTDGATGVVNVTVNGETQSVGLVDSKATVFVLGLTNGTYSITAKYLGDDKYLGSNNTDYKVYVNKISDYDFYVVASDTVVGGNSTVTVYMPRDADGNITIGSKTTNVVGGKAVIVLDKETAAVKDKEVTVIFGHDSKYADKTFVDVAKYDVDKAPSSVKIDVDSLYVIGDTVTITLTPVNGTATVKINGKNYVVTDNKVTFTANVTGQYSVVATIAESNNYYGSSDTKVFDIIKASSSIAIDVKDVYKVGEDIVITLTPSNADGDVNVTVDGISYKVENNKVTITEGLAEGTHTIVANLSNTSKYEASSNIKVFKVVKNNLTITVNDTTVPTTIVAGTPIKFTANLNETVTGDVIFTINGANYTVHVNGKNVATYDYTPVNNATITVVATFAGSDKYNGNKSAPKEFGVNKVATDINVTVKTPVSYGNDAVITVELNATINATVKLSIDGKEQNVALVNGKGVFNASGLSSGNHDVGVIFVGDNYYARSENSTSFIMDNATLAADVTGLNVTVEENTSFVINVTNDFKGNVSIKVGDKVLYNGTVKTMADGAKLLAGNYAATVVFYGDSNYNKLTLNNVKFTVLRVTPAIDVVIGDVTYPANATAVINVGNKANGTVNVTVDGRVFKGTVSNGKVSVNLTGLSAGSKVATVEFFTADDYNNNVTASAKFTINKNTSSISISVESIYKFGDKIEITLKTVNSTGAINVTINGKAYKVDGKKVTIPGGLGAGDYIINAVLAGDKNYTGSTDNATFKVVKNNVTISVNDTTVPSRIVVGTPVKFTANLNETVTGDVIFTINGANYTVHVNGKDVATYDYTPLDNSTITVIATFNGDNKYNGVKSASKEFTVNKISTDINVTVVSLIKVGENAVFTVNMNVTINATVQVKVGDKTYDVAVVNGKGSQNISGLAYNTYNVIVTFAGDTKYAYATNDTTLMVNKIADYAINVTATNSTFGQNATVTVVLPSDVNSTNLVIEVDGMNYAYTMVNGIATAVIPNLQPGEHEVNVTYKGDGKYSAKDKNGTKFRVTGTSVYDIKINVESHPYGEYSIINVTVPRDVENNVTITVDGVPYSVKANTTTGIATLRLNNLSGGLHAVTASYHGDIEYDARSNSTTFTVARASTTIDVQFKSPKFVGDNVIVNVELDKKVNGTVTLHVDNNNYTVYVKNGKGSYNIGDLINKTYSISASFAGDVNFTGSDSSVKKLAVNKIPTKLSIKLDKTSITVGDKAVVSVTLDQSITTAVTVKVNGENYVVGLVNGKGSLTLSDLAEGTYTINATYDGDTKYIGSNSNTVTLKVEGKTVTEMSVDIDVEKGIATVVLPDDVTGNVTVVIDGKVYNVTDIVEIPVTIGIGDLKPGNHTVEVIYSGDKYFTPASKINDVEVPKDDDYKINVDAKVDGSSVDITVSLPKDVIGPILIDVDGVGYYANATGGQAKLHLDDLSKGEHNVAVKYPGDDYYAPNSNVTSFEIDEKETSMSIKVDDDEIVIELPEDATGSVTVSIDGKPQTVPVKDGKAVVDISGLEPGKHGVEVTYPGDKKYAQESNATIVDIPKVDDYKFTADAKVDGSSVDITVSVPKDVTGPVLIDVNGVGYYANATGGQAKLHLDDLSNGKYGVAVKYPGDDKYAPNSNVTSFEIDAKETSMSIKVDDDEIVIELPEDATGNVTVTIDGKPQTVPVKDGKAVVDISDLEPGNHTIEVVYSGDDKYGPGSNSTVVEVPKISDYPVSIDKDGDKLVVSVPDDATGDVTVSVDGKDYTVPIKDGKAVVDISDLAPGNHDVKVTYPGDDKYAPVTNSTTINVPKKSDYPIDITTDGDNLVVSVPEDATGDVTVSIDGKDYTVPIKDGKAVVDISDLPSGTHDVKVTYPGNDKYDQKTVSASIVKERSLVITAPDVVKYFSGSDRFIVYTKDNDGNNISGIEVKITINGKTYTRTSADGKASLALNLNSGNYTVKVEFAGNGEFKPQTINANVEVLPTIYANDVLKVYRNGTQYYALFVDARGNPLVNTNVSFNINGVFYNRTTNATGWAKLNLNLPKGHYILTAINPVTGEMRTNNVIIFTLIESSDLVKHYRNDSQFVVRVRAADGGWAKAGENVTFNINGVFYTRTTNATGHAKLSINIEPGEYIITSYYKDCRESNTIKVLPRLITSDVVMKYRDGTPFTVKTLDEQGNIAPHQQVSFNINGILYNRTTNDQGEAKINLNLLPGEYIITSEYGYERNGNTIKIEA